MADSNLVCCGSCGTYFRLDKSLLGENGKFVRCSKCNHEWLVLPENTQDEIEETERSKTTTKPPEVMSEEENDILGEEKNSDQAALTKRRDLTYVKSKTSYISNESSDKQNLNKYDESKNQNNNNNDLKTNDIIKIKFKLNKKKPKLTSFLKTIWYLMLFTLIFVIMAISLAILFKDSEIIRSYLPKIGTTIDKIDQRLSGYQDDAQAHLELEEVSIIGGKSHKSTETDSESAGYISEVVQFFIRNKSRNHPETIKKISIVCYNIENQVIFQDVLMIKKAIYPNKKAIFTINLNGKEKEVNRVRVYANDMFVGEKFLKNTEGSTKRK